jgi:hypothetical protein
MVTLQRGAFRIEASAVPEPGDQCCVTAEVYEGTRMVRGYFRTLPIASNAYAAAEREVAEDVARMTSEAE